MNDVYTLCKRGPFSSLLTNGRWLFQIIPIYRKALFCFSTSTRIQGACLAVSLLSDIQGFSDMCITYLYQIKQSLQA